MTQWRNKGQARGEQAGGGGKFLLNDSRYYENLLSQSQMPNVAKELVHPGKGGDPLDLLMRCVIKDEKQLNAIAQYFALCDEFELPQEKRALVYRLAGSVSIDGRARKELSMVATGIIAPSVWSADGKKQRDKSSDNGRGGEEDKR